MNQSDFSFFAPNDARDSTVTVLPFARQLPLSVNEDFLLPDSLPDMKKLLRVSFSPRLTREEMGAGCFQYAGDVKCMLLYVTDTNRLREAVMTARFSGKEEVDGEEGDAVICDIRVVQNDTRMQSPRKVSVRLGCMMTLAVLGKKDMTCQIPEEKVDCKTLDGTVESMVFLPTEQMGLPFREDLELDGNLPSVGEVISCVMSGNVCAVQMGDGKGDVECEVTVKCLYESEDGTLHEMQKKYTIKETLEVPEAKATMSGIGMMSVCSVQCLAQENSLGEKRILELDAEMNIKLFCFGTQTGEYERDAYLTDYAYENHTEAVKACKYQGVLHTAFTVNATFPREEENGEMPSLLFGYVEPGELHITYDEKNGKYIAKGNAFLTFVFVSEREEEFSRVFSCHKVETPVKGEIDARGKVGMPLLHSVCVRQVRLRADEEKMVADFDLDMHLLLCEEEEIVAVKEVEARYDQPIAADTMPHLLLYYPTPGETVWDTAKRFRCDRDVLMAKNQLTKDEGIDRNVLIV